MFHKHDFEIICKTKADPTPFEAKRISPSTFEKMAFGMTTVLLKCKKCNKLLMKEMLGKETT